MQIISAQISDCLKNSSAIRKMFEAGIEMKKKFGADNVFDFSLGNPDVPPPSEIGPALAKIAQESSKPFSMGYMPNAGFPAVREKLAQMISGEQNYKVNADQVVITCGAAGGINVFFRTVLTAGEEVITPSPYFVEYIKHMIIPNDLSNLSGLLIKAEKMVREIIENGAQSAMNRFNGFGQ